MSKTQVPYSFPGKDDAKADLQRPSSLRPLADKGPGNAVKARLEFTDKNFYVLMVKIFITYSVLKSMQFIQIHL